MTYLTILVLVGLIEGTDGDEHQENDTYHLEPPRRARIQEAVDKAASWIVLHQSEDGAIRSEKVDGVPALPLTAMALWALSELGERPDLEASCSAAASYLLSFQQSDGGIYAPSGALVYSTSAIARQGLQNWLSRRPDTTLRSAVSRLNLFLEQRRLVQSVEPPKPKPAASRRGKEVEALLRRKDLPQDLGRALEFLRSGDKASSGAVTPQRNKALCGQGKMKLTYDELLGCIYETMREDNPTLQRAYQAIQASYTMRRNPDLTGRLAGRFAGQYGDDRFRRGKSGLYYYYLVVARTLGAIPTAKLQTTEGRTHDWSRELSERLLLLQADEGYWVNEDQRWWEGDPVLVTSYAILSLRVCRDLKGKTN